MRYAANRNIFVWMKWGKAETGVFCDKNALLKAKGKFYKSVVELVRVLGN